LFTYVGSRERVNLWSLTSSGPVNMYFLL
jgi:hypothetical protein